MKIFLILFSIFIPFLSLAAGDPMSIDDQVVRIAERDYGKGIGLKNHAAIYKLKKSHPQYDALLKVVQESLDKKSTISLKADPFSMEIKELRKK
jgi:hypothetical protein